VLAREDVKVHLHAHQTVTEQIQLCVCGSVILENLFFQNKESRLKMRAQHPYTYVLPSKSFDGRKCVGNVLKI
jgi:hypothetical protein